MVERKLRLARFIVGLVLGVSASACLAGETTGHTYSAITGKIVSARTGQPIPNAIVSASWLLERERKTTIPSAAPDSALRLMIRQARTNEAGLYVLPAWTAPVKPPKGWAFNTKKPPTLAVFSAEYEPLTDSVFAKVLELYPYHQTNDQKAPSDIDSDNTEVILWTIRKYIEQETTFYRWIGNEDRVASSQTLLLVLSDELCQTRVTKDASRTDLAAMARPSPCFEKESVYGQIQARQRKVKAAVLSASRTPPKKESPNDIVLPPSIAEKAKK
ncbi:MAG: hypothetical protein OEY67_04750 [Gammaproteobacteria bacterium]|nr:hypothetical protein [Gammaproteobacteria bacterium]